MPLPNLDVMVQKLLISSLVSQKTKTHSLNLILATGAIHIPPMVVLLGLVVIS